MDTEKAGSRGSNNEFVDENSSLIAHENPADDDEELTDIPPWTLLEISITGLAAVAMSMSIVILFIQSNLFSLCAGVLGLLIPPYSAYQEQKLTDCKAMMETSDVMNHELTNLTHENERLSKETDKLKTTIGSLQRLTDTFEEIREMEDASLDIMEEQLLQSKEILKMMKANKLNVILDNIFDIILAVDTDGDGTLSVEEIEKLIKSVESINNVDINDSLFRELVPVGSTIDDMMKLVRNVLDDDPTTGPSDADKVFTFLPAK